MVNNSEFMKPTLKVSGAKEQCGLGKLHVYTVVYNLIKPASFVPLDCLVIAFLIS